MLLCVLYRFPFVDSVSLLTCLGTDTRGTAGAVGRALRAVGPG